jgi:hypothetical protein
VVIQHLILFGNGWKRRRETPGNGFFIGFRRARDSALRAEASDLPVWPDLILEDVFSLLTRSFLIFRLRSIASWRRLVAGGR